MILILLSYNFLGRLIKKFIVCTTEFLEMISKVLHLLEIYLLVHLFLQPWMDSSPVTDLNWFLHQYDKTRTISLSILVLTESILNLFLGLGSFFSKSSAKFEKKFLKIFALTLGSKFSFPFSLRQILDPDLFLDGKLREFQWLPQFFWFSNIFIQFFLWRIIFSFYKLSSVCCFLLHWIVPYQLGVWISWISWMVEKNMFYCVISNSFF